MMIMFQRIDNCSGFEAEISLQCEGLISFQKEDDFSDSEVVIEAVVISEQQEKFSDVVTISESDFTFALDFNSNQTIYNFLC
jgi:hypothetical protein